MSWVKEILFIFYFLAMPCSIQNLTSSTRGGTHDPCIGSIELYSLDCQGVPRKHLFKLVILVGGSSGLDRVGKSPLGLYMCVRSVGRLAAG